MDKLRTENALIIFMKAPLVGKVKTRMQPKLSLEISLELYKAMGKDLVNLFFQCHNFDLIIHYTPEDALPEMKAWLGNHLSFLAQRGANLGEKLHSAFSQTLKTYQKVCIIGSDLPTLQQKDILGSFAKLDLYDVILGPSTDGGYYLVALNAAHSEIFRGINWSTGSVLTQTIQKAGRHRLSIFQLSVKEDIDTFSDLQSFWKYARQHEDRLKDVVPNTIAISKKIFRDK